jgi:hypothetical protein
VEDYFTKDWTARKVLTVGAAGLAITLAMGYAIKTAYTSYKSYQERKIQRQSTDQNQALLDAEDVPLAQQPELPSSNPEQEMDNNLQVFRQPKNQVNVRDSVPEICPIEQNCPKYPIKKNNEIGQNGIFNEIDRAVMEQDVVEEIKDRPILINLLVDMTKVAVETFICNPNSTYMWKSKIYNWTPKYIRYDKKFLRGLMVKI